MRLLPRSLAGNLIVATVIATVLTQTLITGALMIYEDMKFDKDEDRYFFQKIVSIADYLNSSAPPAHSRILEMANDDETTYRIAAEPQGILPLTDAPYTHVLRDYFGQPNVFTQERAVNITDLMWILFGDAADVCNVSEFENAEALECPIWTVSVKLEDGSWLNVRTFANADVSIYLAPFALSVLTSLLGIGGSVTILARKITRPLRDLSSAADQLGRGETARPIAVSGPAEVARTANAFNSMQERLTRFVRDRTTMLAAINHDLRTPITSLRLRAEFIENDKLREEIIETTEEMRVMVDSYLTFSSQEASEETARPVDLTHQLQELAAEYEDVAFDYTEQAIALCHPVSIKRVFCNLIGNGLKYGTKVQITLTTTPEQITVEISDDGPGIPPDMYEEVFTPFTRLDSSRDVSDGSVGLGLSIARNIIRRHGGDVVPFQTKDRFGMRILLPNIKAA